MEHDRKQPVVRFEMLARGYLLSVGPDGPALLDRRYAFDSIEDVARWFIEQYSDEPLEPPVFQSWRGKDVRKLTHEERLEMINEMLSKPTEEGKTDA